MPGLPGQMEGSIAAVIAGGAIGSDAVHQEAARQYGPSQDVVIPSRALEC
ncbi:MAG: hypothetical protein ACRYG8_27865 [Janthinobacterium lividum]